MKINLEKGKVKHYERKNIRTLGQVKCELSDNETPWHQGLSYGRNPMKCLVGPDQPWSPRSIMEDCNNALQLRTSPMSSLLGADRLSNVILPTLIDQIGSHNWYIFQP
jgi:hypothetical protein